MAGFGAEPQFSDPQRIQKTQKNLSFIKQPRLAFVFDIR